MTWFEVLNYVAKMAVWPSLAVCYWCIWRNFRLRRQLQADRAKTLADLDRARTAWLEASEVRRNCHKLEGLLAELCVDACGRDTVPVWRAWASTMGSLKVQVQGQRGTWVVDIGESSDELSRSD